MQQALSTLPARSLKPRIRLRADGRMTPVLTPFDKDRVDRLVVILRNTEQHIVYAAFERLKETTKQT
jgi:hypothetical protein